MKNLFTPKGACTLCMPLDFKKWPVTALIFLLLCPVVSYGQNPSPQIQWATYYGGNDLDYIRDLKCHSDGFIYVCGATTSTTGISTTGSAIGATDGFVAKFDSLGNRIWATYIGGTNHDDIQSMAFDNAGNLYVVGYTYSSTGIATAGTFDVSLTGGEDGFIIKLSSTGTKLWGTYVGGNGGSDFLNDIAIDASNNIFICGTTSSSSQISSAGSHQATFGGGVQSDGFLAKFNASGGRIWSTYYGGSVKDNCRKLAIDKNQNIIVCGNTTSTNNIASVGSFDNTYNGGIPGGLGDVFLAKFNTSGVRQWGTYFGGSLEDWGYTLGINDSNIFVAGSSSSCCLATPGAFKSTMSGDSTIFGKGDGFISSFDYNGNRKWFTYYGGMMHEVITEIKVTNDEIFTIGQTASWDNISTPNSHDPLYSDTTHGGTTSSDYFFTRFTKSGQRIWASYLGNNSSETAWAIDLWNKDNIYLAGDGHQGAYSIATPGAYKTFSEGGGDGYIAKFFDCHNYSAQLASTPSICSDYGALSATAINFQPPLQYNWNTSPISLLSNTLAPAGTYQGIVTDGHKCKFTGNIEITNVLDTVAPFFLNGNFGDTTITIDSIYYVYDLDSNWMPIGFDNCGSFNIDYELFGATTGVGYSLDGQIFNPGVTEVLWTITDESNNLTSFKFYINASLIIDPLPVSLKLFEAKCLDNEILIKWETLSENNNDRFYLFSSDDFLHWDTLTSIKGHINSNQLIVYEYNDFRIHEKPIYYKLLQKDLDGTCTHFNTISSSCINTKSDGYLIYPNPTQDFFLINSRSDKLNFIQATDSRGINYALNFHEQGNGTYLISTDQLSPGIYSIKSFAYNSIVGEVKKLIKTN